MTNTTPSTLTRMTNAIPSTPIVSATCMGNFVVVSHIISMKMLIRKGGRDCWVMHGDGGGNWVDDNQLRVRYIRRVGLHTAQQDK